MASRSGNRLIDYKDGDTAVLIKHPEGQKVSWFPYMDQSEQAGKEQPRLFHLCGHKVATEFSFNLSQQPTDTL